MNIESRLNSVRLRRLRRAEQLKRWEQSETNQVPDNVLSDKKNKIQFSDGCVFLAACAASDTEEVERLLEQGTDINTANDDGLTALHQACIHNNLGMVQFLVEHNCDVNRGDNEGWTPLHATASYDFLSIANYLIENGANVAAVNNNGDLPFDIAESTEMEDYLLDVIHEKEIDYDEARSEEERTMLEDAKLMASSSIDSNDKVHSQTGATPLHVAAAKGYLEVMKILVKAGADLNAQDNDGWTPLHAAAHWCQKEACAILTDNLANMDIQNFAEQTCFDVADPELVKLLEELKKKQASMQKERFEIQEILKRTSSRPPPKRRTSVTRMSGHNKIKSVMKETKSERAEIESLSLPEKENDEDKSQAKPLQKEDKIGEFLTSVVVKQPSSAPWANFYSNPCTPIKEDPSEDLWVQEAEEVWVQEAEEVWVQEEKGKRKPRELSPELSTVRKRQKQHHIPRQNTKASSKARLPSSSKTSSSGSCVNDKSTVTKPAKTSPLSSKTSESSQQPCKIFLPSDVAGMTDHVGSSKKAEGATSSATLVKRATPYGPNPFQSKVIKAVRTPSTPKRIETAEEVLEKQLAIQALNKSINIESQDSGYSICYPQPDGSIVSQSVTYPNSSELVSLPPYNDSLRRGMGP